MKKLSYLFLAAAGLTMASCSQDDLSGGVSKEEGNYAVQVSIPKTMVTRAFDEFGEGFQALKLQVAVYDDGDLVQQFTDEFEDDNLTTTVYFNLARGKSYQIAFFAQSETSINEGVYTFTPSTAVLSVDYTKMSSEGNLADAYDCFLGVLETKEITAGGLTTSITLNRPVAQVNWGTNDLFTTESTTDDSGTTTTTKNPTVIADAKAYGVDGKYIKTNLTVNNPYNSLNVLNNTMTQAGQAVTINGMAAPYTFTFPLDEATSGQDPEDYIYVAMTYLLAPVESSTVYDLNLDVNNQGEPTSGDTAGGTVNTNVEVSAVPVQANYQTNIYGNLLSENVDVTVTKNPDWKTPSYDWPLGQMVAPGLIFDEASNTYTVMNANGLKALVNYFPISQGNSNVYSQYTILLGADIDMTGITDYVPFNTYEAKFDGQDYTISNLTVTATQGNSASLIGEASGGTITNVNLENVTLTGTYKAAIIATAIATQVSDINVTNIKVTSTPWRTGNSGAYNDGNNVAGIVGLLDESGSVTNCSVNTATIIGFRKVGGIVGNANIGNGTQTITGNTIENANIIADLATNYYGTYTAETAGLVGAISSNGTAPVGTTFNDNNTIGENVTTTIIGPGTQASPVELNTIEDLQDLATLVNSGRAYSGKYFQLQDDIDLSDVDNWTPIGKSGAPFSGNFDGNGKTISNLTSGNANTSFTGFFGYTTNGTVSNLNFENANVQGYLYVGVVAGDPYTTKYSDINISGDIYVEGFSYVGGAFGYSAYGALTNVVIEASDDSYVKANSVQGSTAYRTYVGGIVGFPGEGGKVYSGLKSNIDVYGSTMDIGGIVGLAHYGLTFENCECSGNVYITNAISQVGLNQVGGIAGCWMNDARGNVTFTNCKFTGKLYSTGSLQPSIGDTQWNTLNAITGGAYNNATDVNQLIIDGDEVSAQHPYYFPTN